MTEVLSVITTGFRFAIDLFTRLLTASGLLPVFLAVFGALCLFRFVIAPLLGGGKFGHSGRSEGDSK